MSKRLDFATQAELYTLYDPQNHFETTTQKMTTKPESWWLQTQSEKNMEFRKFSAIKNLTPSYNVDLEQERKRVERKDYSHNIQTVEQDAKNRKMMIKNQQRQEREQVNNQMTEFQRYDNHQAEQKAQRQRALRKEYDNIVATKLKNFPKKQGRLSEDKIEPRRQGQVGRSIINPSFRTPQDLKRSSTTEPFADIGKKQSITPVKLRREFSPSPADVQKQFRTFDDTRQSKLSPIKQSFENRLRIDKYLAPVKPKEYIQSPQAINKSVTENRKFEVQSKNALTPTPQLAPTHTLRLSNPQNSIQSPKPTTQNDPSFTDVFSRMNRIRVNKGHGLVSKYGLLG